jgi:chromosome segregation protein
VLDRLRTECLSLLYWRQMGAASGEQQPACADLMKILGDTERIRNALTERIDTSRVEAIAAAVPKPEIALSYCDGTREISFEKASEGQRAAALLFMLLEQPGGPLIIDQPEGDLDNKIIADLTDRLHSAKQNRQLIFASHNANIVVNGSSELVGHLDVKGSGERQFECAGAIDAPSICGVITSTMEGGEKAFKDRQNKYGY